MIHKINRGQEKRSLRYDGTAPNFFGFDSKRPRDAANRLAEHDREERRGDAWTLPRVGEGTRRRDGCRRHRLDRRLEGHRPRARREGPRFQMVRQLRRRPQRLARPLPSPLDLLARRRRMARPRKPSTLQGPDRATSRGKHRLPHESGLGARERRGTRRKPGEVFSQRAGITMAVSRSRADLAELQRVRVPSSARPDRDPPLGLRLRSPFANQGRAQPPTPPSRKRREPR